MKWMSCCVSWGIFCLLTGCSPEPTPPAAPAPQRLTASTATAKPGESITATPTLDLVDMAGYENRLTGLKGKVVLVDFWATWCFPCKRLFPHTQKMYRELQPRGLEVVTLSIDQFDQMETDEEYRKRVLDFLIEEKAITHNWAMPIRDLAGGDQNADELVIERLDLDGGSIPHFKLYDREGQLVRKFFIDPETGEGLSLDEMEGTIHKLLAGQSVDPPEQPATPTAKSEVSLEPKAE